MTEIQSLQTNNTVFALFLFQYSIELLRFFSKLLVRESQLILMALIQIFDRFI